ncbi:MAG: hypothetical protein ACFB16_05920 [Phormidesmis sp.]
MNRFFRPSDDASLEDSEQSATGNFVMMQTLRNYLVVVFSIGVALGAGLSHGMNSVSGYTCEQQTVERLQLTHADYEKVTLQMSLSRVEALLGSGVEVGQSDSVVIFEWRNEDGSAMMLLFEDGYLIQKAQVGLM